MEFQTSLQDHLSKTTSKTENQMEYMVQIINAHWRVHCMCNICVYYSISMTMIVITKKDDICFSVLWRST